MEKAISSYLNLTKTYSSKFNADTKRKILELGNGHMMLTRLIGIVFSKSKDPQLSEESLLADERIALALEEIWENLTNKEKNSLSDIADQRKPLPKKHLDYLLKTGILSRKGRKFTFFSPLFACWVENKLKQQTKEKITDFAKKEKLLFDFLASQKEKLCQRDEIEEAVWPEYQESADMAISDWAIDRLISRLRNKLKVKESNYKIVTFRGQGYKLIQI